MQHLTYRTPFSQTKKHSGPIRTGIKLMFCLSLLLSLCSCSDDDPFQDCGYTTLRYDLTTDNPRDLPLPNNILRDPISGFLNFPRQGEPFQSLNTMRGFSTSAPLLIPYDGEIDPGTVHEQSLMVINSQTLTPHPMTYQVGQNAGQGVIQLEPILPLDGDTTYVVVATPTMASTCPGGRSVLPSPFMNLMKRGLPLIDEQGNSTVTQFDNQTAARLEAVRLSYGPIWQVAEQVTGLGRENLPLAFAFTTQPLFQTLNVIRRRALIENPKPQVDLPIHGSQAVDRFYQELGLGGVPHQDVGAIYHGTFRAPNYLSHPVLGPFTGEGSELEAVADQEISFWAMLPKTRDNDIPVIIFQHSLERSKEDIFAIAQGACSQGFGVIGIDAVMHGERVEDFLNNETGEVGADGVPDPTGTLFINLQIHRMTRDNVRQTVADQLLLVQMIRSGACDFNGDGRSDFDREQMTFLGTSLGGLTGSLLLAVEPDIRIGGLNVPGCRFGKLLPASTEFSGRINSALAEQGIFPNTPEYDQFFWIFQTVMDDADPCNYAPFVTNGALSSGLGNTVLVQEMQDDTFIPNISTFWLVRALGIPQVDPLWQYPGLPNTLSPRLGSGHFQFTGGSHDFFFSAEEGPAAAAQSQMFHFLKSGLEGAPVILNPFEPGGMKQQVAVAETFDETTASRFRAAGIKARAAAERLKP